ncbi:hypothetical protein [cf. Phormidesmis sp. LEGE 11477]|uniref:hypothetical protein n=1 Tax=cf. Phormidesmis sp. LEGE 11477 TaxID=1828680 RepID=UPI0018826655|nr:hypothetical protein [cf. Phormidesmis sp. LEGE 11477]MBE9062667.1 hypothetical protein [cf. Phormidesmis sp. LEGE 11477]
MESLRAIFSISNQENLARRLQLKYEVLRYFCQATRNCLHARSPVPDVSPTDFAAAAASTADLNTGNASASATVSAPASSSLVANPSIADSSNSSYMKQSSLSALQTSVRSIEDPSNRGTGRKGTSNAL